MTGGLERENTQEGLSSTCVTPGLRTTEPRGRARNVDLEALPRLWFSLHLQGANGPQVPMATLRPRSPRAAVQCPWDTRGDAKAGPLLGDPAPPSWPSTDRGRPGALPPSALHWGQSCSAISGPPSFPQNPLTSCHTGVSLNTSTLVSASPLPRLTSPQAF